MKRNFTVAAVLLLVAWGCEEPEAPPSPAEEGPDPTAQEADRLEIFDLWAEGTPAFGLFVPDERERGDDGAPEGDVAVYTPEGGEELAQNPLYDFLFLNLENHYDADAVRNIEEGLQRHGPEGRPAHLVRIPPLEEAGDEVTRERIHEVLEIGADGVVLPEVRNVGEAERILGFFDEAGADVWSPGNPEGNTIAMIMLEDPDAVAQAAEVADLQDFSILACGIGSLTSALGGDREAAEEGVQHVLAEAQRVGIPDMITANADDIEERIEQGFLALLTSGPEADEAIRVGREAVGR